MNTVFSLPQLLGKPVVLVLALMMTSYAFPNTGEPAENWRPQGEQTAGLATVPGQGANAFSFPFANATQDERRRFAIGNSFFRRNWVQAPSSTTARDGLGPHFIARSCGGCHTQDGRGQPPAQFEGLNRSQPVDLLIRLSVEPPQLDSEQVAYLATHGVIPHPVYGDQINNAAVQGVKPEASVDIKTVEHKGAYPDGTPYSLVVPTYALSDLAYGPLGDHVKLSPRIAPQVIGVGLLEAIAEADILANAANQAKRADGVSGRVNRVSDPFLGHDAVGRFGWKANVATLAGQTALAFRGDIGITSSKVSEPTCTPAQTDCLQAPSGAALGEPEIEDRIFNEVVFYQATLAPPARRDWQHEDVKVGEKLFHQSQCAACHRPNYTTGEAPFPSLAGHQVSGLEIWPYTDMLLHDMGPGLADGRKDFQADGQEWKTPPLWGIGLIPAVNGHHRLLHDGRARGVEEAILWHGGEATRSVEAFKNLTQAQRQALIKFVESL